MNNRNRAKPNIYYKEESVIYGKVLCTHCGSDHQLMHIELSCMTNKSIPESFDTIICKSCYSDLPSLEDESEEECQHQWEYLALGKHKQCSQCELKLPIDLKERG